MSGDQESGVRSQESDWGCSYLASASVEAGAIEARVTAPEGPGDSASGASRAALEAAWYALGSLEQYREQHVGPDEALTFSAFWGCVQVISQSLAGVGWHCYERRENDPRYKFPIEDDVAWTLDMQANPETTAFAWREAVLKDALVEGNGYAEIERTKGGRLLWLWRLEPGRVCPCRDDSGRLYYEVENGPGRDPTYLPPESVFHLKGPSPDGLVGWRMVEMARNAIKLGLAEERFGRDFFSRGPMPGGFVKVPGNMTKEQRAEFRRSFEEVYSGARNAHRIVVLSNQVEFDSAQLPNDSAQFLESRSFQCLEVCRFYRVPPHKLADLSRATFSNIEEQEREFVTDCLLPWARRLETEADVKLFGPVNRGRRFTRLNLDSLMRGNSQTQTATVTAKVTSALMTVNEGREYFDLNPVEGGDTPLIQGAMVPLDQAINPPEPAPPAPPPPPGDDGGDRNGDAAPEKGKQSPAPEDLRRAFGPLLADAYARLVRVASDKARRAANKGRLAAHAEWYATRECAEGAESVLAPPLAALALALGEPGAGPAWAEASAARHVAHCRDTLVTPGASAVEEVISAWASWPAEAAELDLRDYSEDQERDDDGRFASGGGSGGAEGDEEEEGQSEEDRVSEERDREDSDTDDRRAEEDSARDDARAAEDAAVEKAREAEGKGVDSRRDAEDAARESKRDAEDRETGSKRDAEDAAHAEKGAALEKSREAEDSAREEARAREDEAVEERYDRGEITDPQRLAEHRANDSRRGREDDRLAKQREKEDAQLEREAAAREAAREKEDEKRERERDREDARAERDREREDAEREKRAEREDSAREAAREKEDREVERQRQREDRERQAKREKEDKERSQKKG